MPNTISRTIECPGCKSKIPLTFVLPEAEVIEKEVIKEVEKPVEKIVEVEKEVIKEVEVEKPVPQWGPAIAIGVMALAVGFGLGKFL